MSQNTKEMFVARVVPKEIYSVCVDSKHNKRIKKCFVSVASSHPEYYELLRFFADYPIQKWAHEKRNDIKLDAEKILDILSYDKESDDATQIRCRAEKLSKLTDKLITLFNKAACGKFNKDPNEKKIICSIHSAGEDVSGYMIDKYYEQALLNMCAAVYPEFTAVLSRYHNLYDSLDDDILVVYHSASVLLSERKSLSLTDGRMAKIRMLIDRCIDMLTSYVHDGNNVKKIVDSLSSGRTEQYVAEEMDMSRTYIRARYQEGVSAISALLWGYVPN